MLTVQTDNEIYRINCWSYLNHQYILTILAQKEFDIFLNFPLSILQQAVLEVILHWWEGSTTTEEDKIHRLREGFRDMQKAGIFEKSNTNNYCMFFGISHIGICKNLIFKKPATELLDQMVCKNT